MRLESLYQKHKRRVPDHWVFSRSPKAATLNNSLWVRVHLQSNQNLDFLVIWFSKFLFILKSIWDRFYSFVLWLTSKRVLNDILKDTRLGKYEGGNWKREWILKNREKSFYHGKAYCLWPQSCGAEYAWRQNALVTGVGSVDGSSTLPGSQESVLRISKSWCLH